MTDDACAALQTEKARAVNIGLGDDLLFVRMSGARRVLNRGSLFSAERPSRASK